MVWKSGESGNKNGRPRKPEIELLRKALRQVQKEKNVSLFKHFCTRALKNDAVLIAFIKKFVPDITFVKGEGFDTKIFVNNIKQILENANDRPSTNRIESGESQGSSEVLATEPRDLQ